MPSPKKKSPKKSKGRVQIDNEKSSQMISNVHKELLTLVTALGRRVIELERRALATEENHEVLSMEVRRLQETVEDHLGEFKWGEAWPGIKAEKRKLGLS